MITLKCYYTAVVLMLAISWSTNVRECNAISNSNGTASVPLRPDSTTRNRESRQNSYPPFGNNLHFGQYPNPPENTAQLGNSQNYPQNQQYYPQNQQYYPQNQQYYPQNQQYYPQNQQYYPQNQQYYPQNQQNLQNIPTPANYPNPNIQPQGPYGGGQRPLGIRDSVVAALESVAYNDELRCVPRLLCEVTSGNAITSRQSFLPFQIDMSSILGMLTQFNFDEASPLLMFGRAALLGYTAKTNPHACAYAYPRCPQDPDRLVQYLNNYNGGFFRYFNGAPHQHPQQPNQLQLQYQQQLQQQLQQLQLQHSQNRPHQNPPNNNNQYYNQPQYANRYRNFHVAGTITAQARILSKDKYSFEKDSRSIRFPNELDDNRLNVKDHRIVGIGKNQFVFPDGGTKLFDNENYHPDGGKYHAGATFSNGGGQYSGTRTGKMLFPQPAHYERPLPNHVATPMIFPTRTGTGELILDSDKFAVNSNENDNRYYNYYNTPIRFGDGTNNIYK